MYYRKAIIFIYIILSFIKFFTVRIDLLREEDPTIYFKLYPSMENTLISTVENGQLKDYYNKKYPWYEKKQYWEIFHSPGGLQNVVEKIYDTCIVFWWGLSVFLIIFSLIFIWHFRGKEFLIKK